MQETNLDLTEKLKITRQRMEEATVRFDLSKIMVAWTGGKDSTLVLYLWQELLEDIGKLPEFGVKVLHVDTGVKFPELLEFRDYLSSKWRLDLHIVRPEVDMGSYPVAEDPLSCCRDLKIEPLKRAIGRLQIQALLAGLRHDEHASRENRPWLEKREETDYFQVNPILHWSEMDVWSFYLSRKLPYCRLYDHGYRSLGCKPCTTPALDDERQGRKREKEEQLKALHSLGYF